MVPYSTVVQGEGGRRSTVSPPPQQTNTATRPHSKTKKDFAGVADVERPCEHGNGARDALAIINIVL